MFNARPDAAAPKWDETRCRMAVLIEKDKPTLHVCAQAPWHTAAGATASSSSAHQSFRFLQPPQRQEGAQQAGDGRGLKDTLQIRENLLKGKEGSAAWLRGAVVQQAGKRDRKKTSLLSFRESQTEQNLSLTGNPKSRCFCTGLPTHFNISKLRTSGHRDSSHDDDRQSSSTQGARSWKVNQFNSLKLATCGRTA